MKVKKILWQHRRDFRAIYECEHCGHTEEQAGYDDDHFHENVITQWTCTKCREKSPADYRPLATKYTENYQV